MKQMILEKNDMMEKLKESKMLPGHGINDFGGERHDSGGKV